MLNIEITSSSDRARFEAPVEEIATFLRHTYQVVPEGEESGRFDVDAELADLLR